MTMTILRRYGETRHRHADRANDLYETPEVATLALKRNVVLPINIWEPCGGRGAIVRVLRAYGHQVIASDLVAYDGADEGIIAPVDFLMVGKAPEGCETIVTNPPFKNADKVIRHGLKLCSTVIVLQRLTALEGVGRSDLIDEHLDDVLVGRERLPMMHRDGWQGNRTTSTVAYAWFVFRRWRPSDEPIALRRISWKDPA